jgi:LacI family transcriptional regulator
MSVSVKDIARVSGFSLGSVDRALNNRPGISNKTKQKILQIAKELNYKPHMLASSLAKGKSMSIGVIFYGLGNRYFAQLYSTMEAVAKARGYFLYMGVSDKEKETEMKLLNDLVSRKVDGLIIFPINKGKKFSDTLHNLEIPVLTIGNRVSKDILHAGIDDFQAAKAGSEYIKAKGYRRIYFVCPPYYKKGSENMYAQERRVQGFMSFAKANPEIGTDVITGREYADEVMKLIAREKGSAYFCSSDYFALNLLQRMHAEGVKAPQDGGLMGFDRVDFLNFVSPSLTTLDCRMDKIGELSAATLIDIIESKKDPGAALDPVDFCIVDGETL